MLTIAIIGANGQVGSEVCLYLSQMKDVRVVPISRTRYGAAFLRRCGLECRIGSLSQPDSARKLFEGCNLVADFSLPKGMTFEQRNATRDIIHSAITHSPPGTPFVYASSYMAYGMPTYNTVMREYFLSHTTYGAMKRDGEKVAFRMGRRAGRSVYALRLGQVHGELQGVSLHALATISDRVASLPTTAHDIVFAHTIADALRNIAEGKERPGLYTLLSEPAWTWTALYNYYAKQTGHTPNLEIRPDPVAPGALQRMKTFLRQYSIGPLLSFARTHRELLTAYLLRYFPSYEARLKASFLTSNAGREIAEFRNAERYKPFSTPVGAIPGKRLRSLADSRVVMEPAALNLRQLIASVTPSP